HFEKRHALPKDDYARTNKQSTKALDQMVQLNSARLGYNHLMSITEEDQPEPEATQRRTAYMTASSSGINQLQVRGKTISLAMLSGDELLFNNMAKSVKQDTTTFLDSQPELKQLRDRLQQQLYSGTYDGGRNLPADLPASEPEKAASLRAMALSDIISVLPGGCIISCPPWGSESDPGALEVVRACPELYGCERYDFVSFHVQSVQSVLMPNCASCSEPIVPLRVMMGLWRRRTSHSCVALNQLHIVYLISLQLLDACALGQTRATTSLGTKWFHFLQSSAESLSCRGPTRPMSTMCPVLCQTRH
ncbi:hypothetical protein DUNSADRAFT_12467, partial [Dunaliella salina]